MATPTERNLIAQVAAHESWARTENRSARTAPARRAMLDKFEQEVDPEGVLSPAERAKRAEHKKEAYFKRLALKSAQARRLAAGRTATADESPPGDTPPVVPAGSTAAPSKTRKTVVADRIADLDGGGDHAA